VEPGLDSLPRGLWRRTAGAASLDVLDVWHFEYFRVVCTSQLSLILGTPRGWETLILRAAFTEECILQGVLALGALSRNVVPRFDKLFSRKARFFPGYSVGYSWSKYGLAIQGMNRRLGGVVKGDDDDTSSTAISSWEIAVLSSLMFIAIEAIQGSEDVARMHLRGALAIYESSQTSPSTYLTPESRRELARVLDALSHPPPQSLMRPINQCGLLASARLQVLPPCFQSTEAARDSLNAISGAINSLGWRRPVLEYQTRAQPNQFQSPLPSLVQEISTLLNLLDSWLALFTAYTSHCPPDDAKATTCTPILLIQYHILQINLKPLLLSHLFNSSSESSYHAHISQFSSVIDLAHTILEARRESYPAPIRSQPGSNFNVAVIQPLFFVACKCRDSLLRRRAIEGLEKVDGDGSEHSRLLARVARWVVQMEEGPSSSSLKIGVLASAPVMPAAVREEDMLSDVEADVPDGAGGCWVTAWKRTMNGKWYDISAYVDP